MLSASRAWVHKDCTCTCRFRQPGNRSPIDQGMPLLRLLSRHTPPERAAGYGEEGVWRNTFAGREVGSGKR